MVMWFCISVPLVFLGAFLGFRQPAMEVPCRTNPIPREVPAQAWSLRELPSYPIGGLLPFGAVFVELFFILSSIWQASRAPAPPRPPCPTPRRSRAAPMAPAARITAARRRACSTASTTCLAS